jgi:hypothetical protein
MADGDQAARTEIPPDSPAVRLNALRQSTLIMQFLATHKHRDAATTATPVTRAR